MTLPNIPIMWLGGLRPDIHDLNRGILFNNVHFSYPSRSDMPIFHGLNLEVPAGSVTAVVGPSGSGKSTLGSLLLRLYDPDQGQVIVGGHDVKTLSPDWLRGAVGTVHQVNELAIPICPKPQFQSEAKCGAILPVHRRCFLFQFDNRRARKRCKHAKTQIERKKTI